VVALINGKLGKSWKEVTVTVVWYYPSIWVKGLRKTTKLKSGQPMTWPRYRADISRSVKSITAMPPHLAS